ncbi:hemolysin type calcium-binding protein [Hasllibacter halocynthiae]|uniref:Hemolysin type calcium-binding protein n=1 Tax=Hasllibacter halocynthiae TaxID=595589 RepID=A0A2T0X1G4_9RHOB|nr:M10 family metallopeptidase C-terminal domain-containing protein [Hasllibacter halocynthiae]PRY92789.1 hemolysin type calcium-binding protein [Hasllibacter halocynthiae]
MPRFAAIAAAPTPKGLRHVSDLTLLPNGRHAAALDRETGEVRAFDLAHGLKTYGPGVAHGLDPLADLRLGTAEIDGTSYVTVSQGGRVGLMGLYGGDRLDGTAAISSVGAGTPLATGAGGTMPAFVASAAGGGIARIDASGTALGVTGRMADTEATYAADAHLAVAVGDYLVTASAHEGGITVWAGDGDGGLSAVGAVGAVQGLGIAEPTALVRAAVAGERYVILGASGSSSLSVLHIGANGAPMPTDHLIDDAASRFGSAQALAAAEVAGRAFVVAGGGDSGLTLLTLMPGGRLVTLDTVAAVEGMAIGAVTAIAMAEIDGALRVVATTQRRQLIEMTIDPGAIGQHVAGAGILRGGARDDLIEGSDGADRLEGGAGSDVLRDGAGEDVLFGGSGADTFVLAHDGATDTIRDFEAGIDRIDLSEWPLLHSAAQIDAVSFAGGLTLHARGEALVVHSHDGGVLALGDVLGTGFLDGFRILPDIGVRDVALRSGIEITGSAGRDVLEGGGKDDLLDAMAGDDRLLGRGGNDHLLGGAGRDHLEGGAGDDLLEGGAGDDRLLGGDGNDALRGGPGNDEMDGGAGDDAIAAGGPGIGLGRGGGDTLRGGAGPDLLIGGDGDDVLRGGDGADLLDGGTGADVLEGGAGDDRLLGGAGADSFVIRPGAGRDVVLDLAPEEDRIVLDPDLWGGGGMTAGEAVAAFGTQEGAHAVLRFDDDLLKICDLDLGDLSAVAELL